MGRVGGASGRFQASIYLFLNPLRDEALIRSSSISGISTLVYYASVGNSCKTPPEKRWKSARNGLYARLSPLHNQHSSPRDSSLIDIPSWLVSPNRPAGCHLLGRCKSKVYPPPCLEPRAVPPEGQHPTPCVSHQSTCQIDQVLHHTAQPAS